MAGQHRHQLAVLIEKKTQQASRLPRLFLLLLRAVTPSVNYADSFPNLILPIARASSCPRARGKWPAGPKGVHGRGPAHILIYIKMTRCCEPSPLQSAALTASQKGTLSARAPSLLRARRRWPEGPEEVHGRSSAHISICMEMASCCEPSPLQSAALTASLKGTPLHGLKAWGRERSCRLAAPFGGVSVFAVDAPGVDAAFVA